ncbi:MAG: DUF2510 domain-containing protein [Microthrixaceae bacterium]
MSEPAGWYPYPGDEARLRFWDGTAWTQERAWDGQTWVEVSADRPVVPQPPPFDMERVTETIVDADLEPIPPDQLVAPPPMPNAANPLTGTELVDRYPADSGPPDRSRSTGDVTETAVSGAAPEVEPLPLAPPPVDPSMLPPPVDPSTPPPPVDPSTLPPPPGAAARKRRRAYLIPLMVVVVAVLSSAITYLVVS